MNDDKLDGTYRGCAVGCTVQPSADGTNFFIMRLRARTCANLQGLEDFAGFALAIPVGTGGRQLLLWAEADDGIDWSYVLAVGQRQRCLPASAGVRQRQRS